MANSTSDLSANVTISHDVPVTPGRRTTNQAAITRTRSPSSELVLTSTGNSSVREVLREMASRRDLLVQLASRDIRIRYKQAVMGFAWALLTPLLLVGAGSLLRVAIAQMSGVALDRAEIGSVVLKSFPWAFFSGAIGFGVASITSNLTLVTKVYFPRAVLPLGVVLAATFDLAIGAGALLVVLPFLGAKLSFALLWVPVLVLMLIVLTAGFAVFLACANLFFRDVKYLTQVLLTFGVFFTPVLFDAPAFGARGARLLMLNPLSPIFEGMRLAVFDGHNLFHPLSQLTRSGMVTAWEPWYLLYGAVWAVGAFLASLVLFQRTQYLFAEYA
jgi:lipopolysaccharide transport system permease protein